MPKLSTIISIMAILIIAGFIFVVNCSPEAKLGKRNSRNALKVQIGMTQEQVLKIMGMPEDSIVPNEYNAQKLYKYWSNDIDYQPIKIAIDSLGRVTHIFNP